MTADEREGTRSIWQAIGRPIVSYCAACFVAAFVLLGPWSSDEYGSLSPLGLNRWTKYWLITSLAIAAIAALPTFLIAGCMFLTRIPRGVAELCAGAMVAPVILFPFLGFHLFDSMILLFMAAGAAAGGAYWLLVGRPRNPKAWRAG